MKVVPVRTTFKTLVIFVFRLLPLHLYAQVNLQHDPRWGRNSNSPSEDPFLTGTYGFELVTGTQSPDAVGGQNLMSSQMKHWTGYAVEANRFAFNANFSLHDLSETYMTPLKMMLKANVSAAMVRSSVS